MYIRINILITVLFILTGFDQQMLAQPAYQTATRSFTKHITCSPSTTFSVYAEKAFIVVTGWNNNYIQARIRFSAFHPDKRIAEKELAYMQYAVAREQDLVELRNIFKLPASVDQIQSKLEIKMELMVPAKIKLQVTNKYGNINMAQLSGNTQVNISFGDLRLTGMAGQVKIGADYSDVRGTRINTTSLNCLDEKSKISLDLEGGNYSFTSKHGDIDLALHKISALTITSTRSDITIRPQEIDACRYKITSSGGSLYLPDKYAGRVRKKGNQMSLTTTGSTTLPLLLVNATFNTVTIK